MKRVFKYPLKAVDHQEIRLPAGNKVLSVETQNEQIVLYALVDDAVSTTKPYLIIIHGTGHDASDTEESTFVGTVKLLNGALMFHVFWRRQYDKL